MTSDIHIHFDPSDLNPAKHAKDVAGIGKDQVEKIVKEVLPDQIRDLPNEVMHEAVDKVIVPVISQVIKPLEKLVFSAGIEVMQEAYDIAKKVIGDGHKAVPSDLVAKAITYGNNQVEGGQNDWYRWLNAIGHPVYKEYWPAMTVAEAKAQVKIWNGWTPFYNELKAGHRYAENDPQKVIDAFNAIAFGVSNTGNFSVGLYFLRVWDRGQHLIDTLKKYEHSGVPVKRSAIMEFVEEVQPDKIDLTGSIKVELGIEFGGTIFAWGIPTILFDILLDDLLKKAGIPA